MVLRTNYLFMVLGATITAAPVKKNITYKQMLYSSMVRSAAVVPSAELLRGKKVVHTVFHCERGVAG